jgi:hypothetical protein
MQKYTRFIVLELITTEFENVNIAQLLQHR